jgi:hypothetical protein
MMTATVATTSMDAVLARFAEWKAEQAAPEWDVLIVRTICFNRESELASFEVLDTFPTEKEANDFCNWLKASQIARLGIGYEVQQAPSVQLAEVEF